MRFLSSVFFTVLLLLLTGLTPAGAQTGSQNLPASKTEVSELIKKVNNYWQTNNPTHGRAFWDNAAYHTGNIEAYKITGVQAYKNFSEAWSVHNQWKGATSDNKANWKYHYGESNDFVLFGDWQIAFQVYIDLYNMDAVKNPTKIARAREVMEYQMSTPQTDYWWWVDGLYMVMPVMTKLYKVTGNDLFLEKLHTYWTYTNQVMWDEAEGLYYRDAKYIFPAHKTASGKKDFWARGNGWAFAAFAKVLQDLPANNAYRNNYSRHYTEMAKTLAATQQPEGHWTRSMLDPEQAPGYETSGTAFFTYGLLWGINNGYLDESTYLPVAAKAWNYLTTVALHTNGRIGYVQPIGERAIPGQVVDFNSTTNFGVGAYLLAAAEMYRYLEIKENITSVTTDALAKQVEVFPNPTVANITVQLPQHLACVAAEVKDAQGRKVAVFEHAFSGEKALYLPQLARGQYFLYLSTAKGVIVKKIIIK